MMKTSWEDSWLTFSFYASSFCCALSFYIEAYFWATFFIIEGATVIWAEAYRNRNRKEK